MICFQEHCRRSPGDYPTMGVVAINLAFCSIIKPLDFGDFIIFKVTMSDSKVHYVSLLQEETYHDLPAIFKKGKQK